MSTPLNYPFMSSLIFQYSNKDYTDKIHTGLLFLPTIDHFSLLYQDLFKKVS